LTPASGCQDHTALPSASAQFVKRASASIASSPASVTIAIRPSVGWTGIDIGVIWVFCKSEYFRGWGLTGITRRANQWDSVAVLPSASRLSQESGNAILPFSPCGRRWREAPDEGSPSESTEFAETDPSPVRDASHRVHPLPQGERGREHSASLNPRPAESASARSPQTLATPRSARHAPSAPDGARRRTTLDAPRR
jgi:hypothetical protein